MSFEIEQAATNTPEFMIEPEGWDPETICPMCGSGEVSERHEWGRTLWCRCRDCGADYQSIKD